MAEYPLGAPDTPPPDDVTTGQPGTQAIRGSRLPGSRQARPLAQLPDYLAPGLDIIFVGINPGVQSAQAGHYYANPKNPFWRLLHRAGLTPRELRPEEDRLLLTFGYGLTDIVKRPSRGAADLRPAEFRRGRRILEEKLRLLQPLIVCFNGTTGFINFFRPGICRGFGRQAVTIGASRVFVAPSTSPANAGTPVVAKLRHFRALRRWREDLAHDRWLIAHG
jgi:TDG/mug DNA glycosylase family protein